METRGQGCGDDKAADAKGKEKEKGDTPAPTAPTSSNMELGLASQLEAGGSPRGIAGGGWSRCS